MTVVAALVVEKIAEWRFVRGLIPSGTWLELTANTSAPKYLDNSEFAYHLCIVYQLSFGVLSKTRKLLATEMEFKAR